MSSYNFFSEIFWRNNGIPAMDARQFLLWKSQNGYIMNEKQFLITLAIRRYNEQYGKSIRPADCDIRSIQTRQRYDRSYEIRTNRGDDYLRLHVHLEFGNIDNIQPYRVELEGQNGTNNLDDEVFVAVGLLDRYYQDHGVYKFRPIEYDDYLQEIILMEDGTPLMDEQGGHILLE